MNHKLDFYITELLKSVDFSGGIEYSDIKNLLASVIETEYQEGYRDGYSNGISDAKIELLRDIKKEVTIKIEELENTDLIF